MIVFALFTYFLIIAHAIPIRENAQWIMLLCKFRDNPYIPHPKEWFEHWLTDETLDGTIASYFRQVSNGLYSIAESKVHGWFELPYSKQELLDIAIKDIKIGDASDGVRKLYLKTKEVCSDHARHVLRISLPQPRHTITVINDEDTAVFCKENGVLVAPRFMMTAAISHEMVHSFFLGHSYSDVNVKVFNYAQIGEYDDRYDLMSTANAYMHPVPQFGSNGPGLNGPHLDYLGWLPANRVYFFGRDGDPTPIRNIRLSSLSRPHRSTDDWLLIMIPYDRDDPQKVYTVELRTKEYSDVGVPKSAIVVHQISRRGQNGYLYSSVLNQGGIKPDYELDTGAEWLVFLDRHFGHKYIRVRVDWINLNAGTAQVTVHSSFSPTACRNSETQRLAYDGDFVCVTLSDREEIQAQNLRRPKTESAPGHCMPGFVLRNAGTRDDVCVTQADRESVQRQNEHWSQYRDFYLQPTFGLNACKSGYVWRQIDAYDYVCVLSSRRNEISRQNADDRLKRATFLSECFDPFVFRKAFPNDDICVTQEEHGFVEIENSRNLESLVYPKFFNGEDKLD